MRQFFVDLLRWLKVLSLLAGPGSALPALSGCSQQGQGQEIAPSAEPPVVKFTDVTKEAGILFRQTNGSCGQFYFVEQVAAGAAFLDANGDGSLDIYFPQPKPVGVCKPKFKAPLHQRLYMNDGKGRFTLAANAFGHSETDYGIGAAAGDYDNDGDVDLYVTCYGRNTLYRNRGDGTFEDVTKTAHVGLTGMSTGAAWFDSDGDGYLDLYVARYCEWTPEQNKVCWLASLRSEC